MNENISWENIMIQVCLAPELDTIIESHKNIFYSRAGEREKNRMQTTKKQTFDYTTI